MCARHAILGLAVLLAQATFTNTAVADHPPISGKWSGVFENSLGFDGEDALNIMAYKDGTVTGTWDGKKLERGERVTENLFQWEANKGDYRYCARCHVKAGGKALLIEYTVTTRSNDRSVYGYTGTSVLTRR